MGIAVNGSRKRVVQEEQIGENPVRSQIQFGLKGSEKPWVTQERYPGQWALGPRERWACSTCDHNLKVRKALTKGMRGEGA